MINGRFIRNNKDGEVVYPITHVNFVIDDNGNSVADILSNIQAGEGGGSSVPSTVINNLESTSTTSALSAYQGRVLKGLVDSKQGSISDLATIRSGASKGATALQSGDVYSKKEIDTKIGNIETLLAAL